MKAPAMLWALAALLLAAGLAARLVPVAPAPVPAGLADSAPATAPDPGPPARFDAPALFADAPPPPEPAIPAAAPQPEPGPVLVGVAREAGAAVAWMRAGDAPARRVEAGEAFGSWRLETVEEAAVVLARNGERRRLVLFGPGREGEP